VIQVIETELSGVFVVESALHTDERGFFARTWCRRELTDQGLETEVAQMSLAHSQRRGTLRGLHYQASPYSEVKWVTCIRGTVFDVVVDLRQGSKTWGRWVAVTLVDASPRTMYIPQGCAHGYLTLSDDCVLSYMMSEFYHPEAARGVRWDDPQLDIAWPEAVVTISSRDRLLPGLTP